MQNPNYLQIQALHQFENTRRRAHLGRLWHHLVGEPQTLLPFEPIRAALPNPTGIHRGLREVPVCQIVGSVGRANDYDRSFRPLHDAQRGRWVNIRLLHATCGWQPILVHTVGNLYFVEDGHHRVSVARAERLDVIEAVVIEYPVPLRFDMQASLEAVLKRLEGFRRKEAPKRVLQDPPRPHSKGHASVQVAN